MKAPVPSFLISSFMLVGALAAQGEKVTLRFAATPDTTVFLVITAKMEQNIDMGGQSMEVSNTVNQTVAAKVLSSDEKGAKVEFEVRRVHGSMTLPMMGDVEFDSWTEKSEDGEEGMAALGGMMTTMAGKKFTATVDPRGEITAVDGVKEAVEAAKSKGGGMGRMMRGLISEDSMKQALAATILRCPAEPLAVGGKWERSEKRSSEMPLDNKVTATLDKVDGDNVVVKLTGTVSKPAADAGKGDQKSEKVGEESDEEAAMRKEMMEKMEISEGKVTGNITASRKDGFVVNGESVTSMKMTMPSPMGGGEMTIDSKVSSNVKRVTKEETQKPADKKPADKKDESGKTGAGK